MGRILFALLVIASTAAAQPKPAPKPPSTGKELAHDKVVLPADQQAEIIKVAIKKGDCTDHVAMLSTALSIGGSKVSDQERITAYDMLQKCAKASKSWNALVQADVYLLDHAPDKTNAEDLIDAYLKLGEDKIAVGMLPVIAKAVPSQKANLAIAITLIDCHNSNFQNCLTSSGHMLDALAKMKPEPKKAIVENRIFHAFAAAALGKYDVYDADMKVVETMTQGKADAALASFKTVVDQARSVKLFVDEDHATDLALGTYHLLTSGKFKNGLDGADALVTLRLVNQDKKQKSVKVTVEIPGVTDAFTETIALPPGKQVTKLISPPLKMDFDVAKLRAPRAGQIALHVTDPKGASLLDKSLAVQILPRDNLPLKRAFGNDELRTTFNYAAAWVTPNAPEIDAFIKKAKARLTGQDAFSGEQQPTMVQVKALFDELKARGVSYVEDPRVFDERGAVQRTRLPAEVLASTNAQCLEGTLLYASLMEAIGLQPVLVFKKGHAFIAWKPSRFDKTKDQLFFLETTMTGGPNTFEEAVDYARNNFIETEKEGQFKRGIGALIDIRALRLAGYVPQPY
jgi:hypothetical protein